MDYSTFIAVFPELECELEPGQAFAFWLDRATKLLEALCYPIDDNALALALAHVTFIKANPDGPLKGVENVNSSVTYQSVSSLNNPELTLQLSPYGKLLYEELSLHVWDGDIDHCWPNY